MACKSDSVQLKLLDRKEVLTLPSLENCEELWRFAAKTILGVKPGALEIFGIKHGDHWLGPCDKIPKADKPLLELRLRFKTPHPERLRDVDKAAFRYYYSQVRHDLDHGIVLKTIARDIIKEINAKSAKWYVPVMSSNSDQEAGLAKKKRVKFLTTIVSVVSLNIVIDILVTKQDKKEVLKNFDSYIPKEIWANAAEKKLVGLRELKQTTLKIVDPLLSNAVSVDQLKLEFLNQIEANFKDYYLEIYPVIFQSLDRKEAESLKIKIVPPFKLKKPPRDENEAYLAILASEHREETQVCNIEEICNISISEKDEEVNIELARKNGVPLYLIVKDAKAAWSLLTTLTGYYRLCEKWIFCLCPNVIYPSLSKLLEANVHGPVDFQFVLEKFKASPERQQAGTFLVRQSCIDHYTYFLDYVFVSAVTEQGITERSLRVVHIIRSKETGTFSLNKQDLGAEMVKLEECYNDLKALIKDISGPLGLKTCLHPSEYDRAATLLICRSDTALSNDIIGQDKNLLQQKVFLPLASLQRIENVPVMKGRFTKVWKAQWSKGSKEKKAVAIKQLKHNDSHLLPFMQMCNNAMLWDDSTLIKVYGATLAIKESPIALVMEYLPLGPMNVYLQNRNQDIPKEDLLESAVSLARALLHLEEQKIVHSNIRLRNVLVASHAPDAGLKVKLGDPGLADYSRSEEVHWLSFELLIDSCPTPSKCTLKGDVWAFATTLWELFSYGDLPQLDLVFSKEQYLNGHRLAMPRSLQGELSTVYGVMQGCWYPLPEVRSSPHTILRDLNQLLYKVFNAKKVHTYVPVSEYVASSPEHSVKTAMTSAGGSSNDTVIYLSSEESSNASRSPEMPQRGSASQYNTSFYSSDDNLQRFGDMPHLAPLFTNLMNRWRIGESSTNLISDSRSASSMGGFSTVASFRSQSTMQTSISSLSTLTSQYSVSVYQINEAQIRLNKDRPLGEGNFGIVYKGVWTKTNEEWEEVAVKMLKDFNDPSSEKEIERELNMMRRLNHENIVRIHGVFSVADTGNTAFAMEFVREGSLDNYLRTHKNHLKVPQQLFIFADNICNGMIYLSREGIIHRDLAARNILVATEECVKISDFGLARQPQGKDYYTMSSHTNIPVKWMAVESLTHGIFHKPSDVWSFGVVLWEMFTFGASPCLEKCEDFFKVEQSDEVIKAQMQAWIQYLHEGARFPKPELCPTILYSEVMLHCWNHDANNRPSFEVLQRHLERIEKQVT